MNGPEISGGNLVKTSGVITAAKNAIPVYNGKEDRAGKRKRLTELNGGTYNPDGNCYGLKGKGSFNKAGMASLPSRAP